MQNMCIRKLVLLKRKHICRENSHGIFCVASSENPNCSRLPWIHSQCCNNRKERERHGFLHWSWISVRPPSVTTFSKYGEENCTLQWPMSVTKEAGRSIQLLRQWTKQKIWVKFLTWTQVSFMTFRKSFSCLGFSTVFRNYSSLLCPPLSVLPVKLKSLFLWHVSRSSVLRGNSDFCCGLPWEPHSSVWCEADISRK